MRPTFIGEQVYVLLDPAQNNGADHAVGWVVRDWGAPFSNGDGKVRQTVNVRVLGDGPDTLWLTSIPLFEQLPSTEELASLSASNPRGYRTVAFRKMVDF